ncbi:F-actin-uncapping protein LRRC16A isoform X3 [Frankliniella occidentalis]|uniref:F-actin-uncapping protein LRRC16A isoform X3 n=1 Tax=Frankliniella occidentalis TaxID=133901 RepID=A0A6J1S409_FRAOC|nr:F-actin-uncapping protein LRRC16A isoform X3 [Frankliniella occidentalis]
MSTRSQLTKDLNESVKALLGKHVKILLKNVVKMETKGDKTENRVLVFSPCRLFLLTAKVPTRIDFHFHYLEIQAVSSVKNNQLCLTVHDKGYSFLTSEEQGTQEVDAMIAALATAMRNIFPTVPIQHIIRKIEVQPPKRIAHLQDGEIIRGAEVRGMGPCGGFSTQYACMCDFHGMPYRDEVAWDVDTIYLSHDTRELSLKDFDHLDSKDLVPIISALEYNTWFTKVRGSNICLTREAIDRILHVVKNSLSIEELYLDSIGLKADFAHKLSMALISNTNTALHTLDLSNNMIEDKGINSLCGLVAKLAPGASHLSGPLAKVPKGLVHLNLSSCGLTSKGINQLANALAVNKFMPNTLTYLNLSNNSLKEDVTSLCNFLAQPNVIKHLDISKTEVTLEAIFGALLRGCSTNLVHLNVSHNLFSTKKHKEVPLSFKQFFTSTLMLKYLNMSYCKLPLEALKNLLLGLACNETTSDMELDMSCNNLGTQGAHVFESCIHGVRCIGSLDISDNNMDVDLAGVVTAISKNKSIKHLNIGRNMANMKAKHIVTVMEAVVQMLQEEDCVLQTLNISDSKLKSDLFNLINALGSNQCLQSIDISGNMMGDGGARLLAKALQINCRLRSIQYDRNNITLPGYCDLAYALESNYTVRYMPVPLMDLLPCMKVSAERTDAVMKRIQDIVHRNVSPKKYSNGQAFRLQQGFLLSSTQQMVDRLVVQTQETIKVLAQSEDSALNNNHINHATGLIQDADNSKQLLPRLQEVVQRRHDINNPIDKKLRSISEDLHTTIVDHLQGTLEAMMRCANEQCPTVLDEDRVQTEIRKTCREKNQLASDFVQTCVMEQAGTDIINRVNELNLAAAAHMSDRITDEVIESLSRCYKNLAGDNGGRKRASTPDVLRTRCHVSSDSSRQDLAEVFLDSLSPSLDESPLLEYLNLATPHLMNKRKSLHGRKLRPKSVVDSVDGLSADHIPDLLPSLKSSEASSYATESSDSVSELPKSVGQQLQHLVKGRPRRAKTRAPTRPMLRPADSTDTSDLGEGLDTFFRPGSVTPTTPLVSPTSDDSSSTFPIESEPESIDSDRERRNGGLSVLKDKSIKSSPLMKGKTSLLDTVSRSPDLLDKNSPLAGRRPPTAESPLVKRGQDSSGNDPSKTDVLKTSKPLVVDVKSRLKPDETVADKPASPTAVPSVRLRSTGLADSLRSPTNGFPKTGAGVGSISIETAPKSPILKSISKDGKNDSGSKVKAPPPIAPKPRPWSMGGDRKSGEFSAPSDGSSPNTSAANTPDSGDALDESTDSGLSSAGTSGAASSLEKKSVRELAASLNKVEPDAKRKTESDVANVLGVEVGSCSGGSSPQPFQRSLLRRSLGRLPPVHSEGSSAESVLSSWKNRAKLRTAFETEPGVDDVVDV